MIKSLTYVFIEQGLSIILKSNVVTGKVFKNIKNPLNVTRYHSLKIDEKSIPKDIVVTARTKEGVIMGIRHKFYNIEGIQFHPEAHLTECGHAMFENFIKKCKKGDKVEF